MAWPPTVPGDSRFPLGVRASAWLAAAYTLTAGGATAPGSLSPVTQANRLYLLSGFCPATDPVGFTAGLFIVTPHLSGADPGWGNLHHYLGSAYTGWQSSWLFHSGAGGDTITWFLRTTSTMKTGASGIRTTLIDLGYSTATAKAIA